jgi:hypothetical protein
MSVKTNVNHLIVSIETTCILTEDRMGNLYCSITLEWDYVNQHVDIAMPNYIKKKLQENGHIIPTHLHSCPYHPEPRKFGTEAQPLSLPTLPIPSMPRASNKFNKLWVAFYTMPGPLT